MSISGGVAISVIWLSVPVTFGILTLIVACGLVGPLLASATRLAVPVVVGEIAAGVLLGRTGLQEIHPDDPTLTFLSAMGFAMLMFIVGTRLPLRDRGLRRAVGTGAIATAVSFAVAIPAAWLIADLSDIPHVPMFVVLLATSSAAVVMPIVGERNLIGGPLLAVLAWITLTDIVSIVGLPLALEPDGALKAGLGAVAVSAAAILAFVALRGFRHSRTGHALRKGSKTRGWALDLRISLLVLFGLSALAVKVSTSILVAGFAAGVAVALAGEPKRLARQMVGLAEGFFVPLFFVTLGARLDVRALATSSSDLALAGMLIVGVVACHVLVARVLRMPNGSGLLASAQLGLPAGVVTLGLASHAVDAAQAAAIVLAALASLIISSIGAAVLARDRGQSTMA
jgi:Kef-type K+ transport system membrane component KefB